MNIDDTQLTTEARTQVDVARDFNITNEDALHEAGAFLVSLKGVAKRIRGLFKEQKQKTDEAHKAICKQEKNLLTIPNEAEGIIKPKISKYMKERDDRLAAEAREREAAERKRIEDAQIAEAAHAEKQGEPEKAEVLASRPIVVAPSIPEPVKKVAGISRRKSWKYRIADKNLIPRKYWVLDEKKIRAQVNSLGMDAEIPGVEVYPDTGIAARA